MKIAAFPGIFLLLSVCKIAAQTTPWCGADFMHHGADPALQHAQTTLDAAWATLGQSQTRSSVVQTVPVVFHLVHNNGPENLTDAQITQALVWLNNAYAHTGPYSPGVGVDVEIQFCAAQRTPFNTATNGVTRTVSTLTSMTAETQDLALKNLIRWQPKDYINIWVVNSINSTTYGPAINGYAYSPSFHGGNLDGIVVESNLLLSAPGVTVLAHELGHYFGLYHTFRGGCANDNCLTQGDQVCDTPPDQSTSWLPCGQSVNTCTTDVPDGPDMTSNFMDYGNADCMFDFTQGQADRMHFFLQGARASLLESKGCLPPCLALVTASFVLPTGILSAGQTVQFTNTSQNAIQYQWMVNGQVVSTQPQPGYTFGAPGVYTIQLTAIPVNTQLCESATATQLVQVVCPVTASIALSNTYPTVNEPVVVTFTGQNAGQTTWALNGQPLSGLPDTLVFDVEGNYILEVTAGNGFCTATDAVVVDVQDSCRRFTFIKTFGYQGNFETRIVEGPGNTLVVAGTASNVYGYFQTDGLGNVVLDRGTSLVNGNVRDVAVLSDGRVVLIGNNGIVDGESRIVVVENDGTATGRVHIPLSPQIAVLLAVKATPDGGFIVCGSSRPSTGGLSGAIYLKYDASFNLEWSSHYRNGFTVVYDILPLHDGGYLACGVHPPGNVLTGMIHRLTSNGSLLWARNYTIPGGGGFFAIADIPGGGYLLAGQTQGYYAPQDYLCVDSELWATRITEAGDVVWSNLYSIPEPLCLHDWAATPQGSLVLCGVSSFGGTRAFSMHLGTNGEVLFAKRPDAPGRFTSIAPLSDGGYAMAFITGQGLLQLHRVDALGNNSSCPVADFTPTVTPVVAVKAETVMTTGTVAPLTTSTEFFFSNDPVATTVCAFACDTVSPRPELCANGEDDDGDGLFDCLDPDCGCVSDPCEPAEGNRWYFGIRAGLDFSTSPPTVLTDGSTTEMLGFSSAVATDQAGNLLFYSDGNKIYNRMHQPMPVGNLNPGQFSADVLVLDHPGQPGVYYLFTAGPFVSSDFRYSVVDMALDNGLGDVPPGQLNISMTDIPLPGFLLSPSITAVRSCTFNGYWLLVHSLAGNQFLRYRIDENGLNPSPVLINVGTTPINDQFFYRRLVKFSPDGYRVALTGGAGIVELFDFDPTQFGLVTNPLTLTLPGANIINGIEFSPDSRYLYVVLRTTEHSQVWQFDLSLPTATTISASGVLLGERPIPMDNSEAFGNAQLAPDGTLLIATVRKLSAPTQTLDIIHYPNRAGAACLLQTDAITVPPVTAVHGGLCNFPSSLFRKPFVQLQNNAPDSICLNNDVQTLPYFIKNIDCGVDSVRWELIGLSGSIDPNYQYADVTFTGPGEGLLVVTTAGDCQPASDSLFIRVFPAQPPGFDLGPDTVTVCDNGIATFDAGPGWARYRWSDGSADRVFSTLLPGRYWVEVQDACGYAYADTVNVLVATQTTLNIGADTALCGDQTLVFQRPAGFVSWQWTPANAVSCDTCAVVNVPVNNDQTFFLFGQTADGCISTDSFRLDQLDTLSFVQQYTLCKSDSLLIFGVYLPADTKAYFLFPAEGDGCDTLHIVKTIGIDQPVVALDTMVCRGQTFVFRDLAFPPDTFAVVSLPSPTGCDTLVEIQVGELPGPSVQLPADTTLKIGSMITINGQASGYTSLQWTPADGLSCSDCLTPDASPTTTILYSLQATDAEGCTATDAVLVTVLDECFLYIPNAFTPDGDGTNDVFYPRTDPCVSMVRFFAVYNRWGETVFTRNLFEPNNPALGWDGDGHPMDVYVWRAELEYVDGRVETAQGEVTLLK